MKKLKDLVIGDELYHIIQNKMNVVIIVDIKIEKYFTHIHIKKRDTKNKLIDVISCSNSLNDEPYMQIAHEYNPDSYGSDLKELKKGIIKSYKAKIKNFQSNINKIKLIEDDEY